MAKKEVQPSKAKKQISGFTDFVREQGVVGLAVGLAIGVASGATVKAIVDGFINPIIGFILGGANLNALAWHTGLERGGKELIISWGSAANSLLTLIATAAVIYFLVNGLKLDKLDKKKD
jgi:large conductance mechanosensitive channel